MLQDYYYNVDIYREEDQTDDWGNLDDAGNWVYSHSIEGFLQSRGGGMPFANQANVPLSSHVLYTNIGVDVVEQDRILVEGKFYRIDFTQTDLGISGVDDHQEVSAEYLNDL